MEKIAIFFDSCSWNRLFELNIDLATELPNDQFDLFMTKEVSSFELDAIPDNDAKRLLKTYISKQIKSANVKTFSYFGFSSYNDPPEYKSRVGGFGEGFFASYRDLGYIKRFEVPKGKEKKSGLYRNEADASLAVHACTGKVVLTAERKNKPGPLKEARSLGGKVIYLEDFDYDNSTMRLFILEALNNLTH